MILGVLVDHLKPKLAGLIAQAIVLVGLFAIWLVGHRQLCRDPARRHRPGRRRRVASRWRCHWRRAGIRRSTRAPRWALPARAIRERCWRRCSRRASPWRSAGSTCSASPSFPSLVAFVVYIVCAKDSPDRPAAQVLSDYLAVLRIGDAWWFMFFYSVTFGGFVGLASSLTIYFNVDYGLTPSPPAISPPPACSRGRWCGRSAARVADRFGGIRALTVMYIVAAIAIAIASFHLPMAWMALTLVRGRHARPGDGQRLGLPVGAAAVPHARSAS